MIHATTIDYVRSLLTVAADTLTIYIFLVAGFRLLGRRQLGQLNCVDLVIILIMGSAVETSLIAGDVSLPAGLVSAGTLLAANRLFALFFSRSKRLRRLLSGTTFLVISRGKMIPSHLRSAGLTEQDVLQALRQRGCCDIESVKFAVLEENGEINVVTYDTPMVRTEQKLGDKRLQQVV